MARRSLLSAVPAVTVALLLSLAATAQGAIITIGSLRADAPEQTNAGSSGSITLANLAVGGGGLAASPVDGTIVRWHLSGAKGGPFSLRVLRPAAGGYVGVGTSAGEVPSTPAQQTFATSLPLRAGDLIAIDTSNKSDEVGGFLAPGSRIAAWEPPLPEGASIFPSASVADVELTFNAEVQPTPKITALSPATGSIAGGATVALTGSDFLGATAVSFGGKPAALFPVVSDSALGVVVPKTNKPGPVDVTVTTAGGTSAAISYTYVACRVPKLKGRTVKAARKALRKANCKPGKVRGQGPRVVKQTLKAGTIRPAGSRVGLKRG